MGCRWSCCPLIGVGGRTLVALEPHGSRSSVVKDYAIKTTMNEGPCRPEVHKVLPDEAKCCSLQSSSLCC